MTSPLLLVFQTPATLLVLSAMMWATWIGNMAATTLLALPANRTATLMGTMMPPFCNLRALLH